MSFKHNVARRALWFWLLLFLLPFLNHRGKAQTVPPTTLTFLPVADTYVDASLPANVMGAAQTITTDSSPQTIAYLRFAVSGVTGRTVQTARLRLGVFGKSVFGGTIHKITNSSWDETTTNFNNRPAVDGPGLFSLGAIVVGQVVEFNLDGAITGDGIYNLAIDSTNTDGADYNSKEATSGQKPTLVLTLAASANPTVSITQPANGAAFFVGDAITLQGTAQSGAGADMSSAIQWSSNLTGALGSGATVHPTLGQGSHTITASVLDGSLSASSSIGITVNPPPPGNTEPLVTITAPTDGATLAVGVPVSFTGTASDLENGNLTGSLSWSSNRDGALGTGGSFTRTLSAGTHQITATVTDGGGLTGTATVSVQVQAGVDLQFPAVADAYVDAGQPSLNFGPNPLLIVDANTQRIAYLRFDVTGIGSRTVLGARVRMQVNSAPGAESPVGGTLNAISNNSWLENSITFANRPPLDGLTLGSAGNVVLNQLVDFDATAAISGNGSYNFAITSSSSDEANYRSRDGGPAPQLIVTVSGSAPTVAVTGPAHNAVFFEHAPITFTATASDVEDGDLASRIQWTSSRDSFLGTGGTLVTSGLSIGTHVITAAATDNDNLTSQSQISVRVRGPNQAPVVSISSPADPTSRPAGTPVTLTASATDEFDGNISGQITWTSNQQGSLGTGSSRTVTLTEGAHTIVASVTDSDGTVGSATVHVTITATAPVVAISAPADGLAVFGGTSIAFSGTATDATDGNLTNQLHWVSSRDGLLHIGGSFSSTTLSVGVHTITASVTDASTLTGQAQRTITVRPPNVAPTVTIAAPANNARLLTGKPVLVGATARDTEDGDISSGIRWSSSLDGNLGTGALVTIPSLSVGTHVLTATSTDSSTTSSSASVTVIVSPTQLTFAAVADTSTDSGNPTSVAGGSAVTLTADNSPVKQIFMRFSVNGVAPFTVQQAILRLRTTTASAASSAVGGTVGLMSNNSWSEAATNHNNRPTIDGATLATKGSVAVNTVVDFDVTSGINADGTFNLGLTTTSSNDVIYGSREAASGQPQLILTLNQNQAPIVRIIAPPTGHKVVPGTTVNFAATANDAESGNLGAQIQWTSSLDGALGTGASINVSTLRAGTHTITARATDAGSVSGQAQISVQVLNPPVVTITSPASGAVFFQSDLATTLSLGGTATDIEDGNLSGRIEWRSDRDGALATGASISVSTLSIGTHVITAKATDDDGLAGQAQISIRVRGPNQAPQVNITAPAAGAETPAGTAFTFMATASDEFDGDLSSQVQWSAAPGGSLGTGATRTAILAEGLHTVTATVTDSNGVSSSTSIQVRVTATPPVVTITAPAAGARVFGGTTVAFSATATDATDGNVGASLRWTSDRDGQIGTGPGFTKNNLTIGTHVITATATDAGTLTGEAHQTLIVRPPNVPPTIAITAPATGTSLLSGKPILLSANALDTEDGNLGTRVSWSSSLGGALGSGALITVPSLAVGTHTLTAAVTDLDGASATANVSVTVTSSTMTFEAVQDTWVDSGATSTINGARQDLIIDNSPIRQTFLRFAPSTLPSGAPIERVVMRLTATSASAASSPMGGELHTITDATWSEAATRYSNRPAVDGPIVATAGAVAVNQAVEFVVTSVVTGNGSYNFALISTSSNDAVYNSRDAATGKPQLIVTLGQTQRPVVQIVSPENGRRIKPGTALTFTGTARDAEDGDLSAQIQWTSNRDGNLGTGATVTSSALTPGAHTITARVTDQSGLVGQTTITVEVTHPPVVSILAPANGRVFFTSELPITFNANATDAEDGNLGARVQWRSDRDGALAGGPSISVSDLSIGTHVISADVTDDDGLEGEGQITIRVRGPNEPPALTIMAPSSGASVEAGTPMLVAATATDDFDGDLSPMVHWSSSRDGVLFSGASRSILLTEGPHTLTATVTDSDGEEVTRQVSIVIAPSAPHVTISAPADGTRVFVGTSLTFLATAIDATDGNVSSGIRWTSDRDGLLGSGSSLTTDHLTVGAHVITAAATDSGLMTGVAQLNVVIRPQNVPPVVTITSPADGGTLLSGKPVVLGAYVMDAEDGDLSAGVQWASSRDGNLGTGATVLRSSLSAGLHTLTATVTDLDGATGTASVQVTVVPGTLTIVASADTWVDSGSASSRSGGTASTLTADNSPVKQIFFRFPVTGIGSLSVERAVLRLTVGSTSAASSNVGGQIHSITNNTWSESTTSYSTRPAIDGPVLATRTTSVARNAVIDFDITTGVRADGTFNFALATTSSDDVIYSSREASAALRPQLAITLAQNTKPAVVITAPLANATLDLGVPITFRATATDAETGDVSAQIQWTSNLDGVLGTGATISRSNLRAGTHVIMARVTDAGGLSGEAQITVNVGHTPEVHITAPQNLRVFFTSELPIVFTGTAMDAEDGNMVSRLQWTSDKDGVLGSGASLTRSLSIGTHVITASVTDVNNLTGQAQITIRVRAANVGPTVTIIAPTTMQTPAGTPVTLTGTAMDDFDGNISNLLQWTSSRDGALFTGSSKSVVLTEGIHTLTASVTDSDGVAASAQITFTVTPTPPGVTIATPAEGATLIQDVSTSFNGTALDATEGDISSALVWTSDRDGQIGTGGSFSTTTLSPGMHLITASATDAGNLMGSASIHVRVIRIPTVRILLPDPNAGFLTGNAVTFFATATDTVDGDVSATLVWTSDRDGQIGTGRTFSRSNLSLGTHHITAAARNSEDNVGEAQVTLTVNVGTLTFTPIQDTYGDEAASSTKFGTSTELSVGSTSPTRKQTFLRFDVQGIDGFPVVSSRLEMVVGTSSTSDGGFAGTVNLITNNDWSEANTTWANRPAIDGPVIGSVSTPVVQGQRVTWDLGTAFTANGIYNLAVTSPNSNAGKYESRESSTVVNRPKLTIMLGQPDARHLPEVTITSPTPGATLFDDQTVTLTGTAMDQAEGNLTNVMTWTSSRDGVLGTGGTVSRQLSRGAHTITASAQSQTGLVGSASVEITVADRPPAVVITAPADGHLFPLNFAAVFTATANDDLDGDLGGSIAWTSDRDGAIGTGRTITRSTLSPGDHRITASVTNSLNTVGSASIVIAVGNAAPRVTITGPATGTSITEGAPLTLTGTASDTEDGDITNNVLWTSDLQGALGSGGTVPAALTVGTHTITASATDTTNQTRSASISVIVTPAAPVLTIVAPVDGYSTSGSVTFTGTALDVKDGDRSSQIRWSSDVAGNLGTGGTIVAARLTAGRHVVTASVTDSDNLTATRTVTIAVGNVPPVVTITAPANGASAPAGTAIAFAGSATDAVDGNVSTSLRWFSNLQGQIGTGTTFSVSNLARGAHVITARATDLGGLTGSTSIVVNVTASAATQGPQVTITAPANGSSVDIGVPVTFSATAVGGAGNLSAGLSWVSDLDGVIGSGGTFTTSSLAPGTHHITASVSDSGGAVGSATITLTINSSTLAVDAVADAYTDQDQPTVNFGTAPILLSDNSPVKRVFLRFVVSQLAVGETVQRAVLRLTTTSNATSNTDSAGELYTVTDWDEATITHNFKPAFNAPQLIGTAGAVGVSATVDWDVTSVFTGNGTYNFGVKTPSSNGAEYVAREGGAGKPQLILFRQAPTGVRPVVHITAPAEGAVLQAATPTTFTATATDPQDGNVATSLVWRSDKDGVLGNGPSITATLSSGSHVITATATDSTTNTGTDLIHVVSGSGGPTVTILAPVNLSSAPLGQEVALIGTAFDSKDGDLSFGLQWSSSIDGPLGTGPSFTKRLSAGTHTLTATVVDSDTNRGTATSSFTVSVTRVGYEDFAFTAGVESGNGSGTAALDKATATKQQSKLWYTQDQIWWAVLFVGAKSEYHIHRLDTGSETWIDTGIKVDERGKSRYDALYDRNSHKLYIASRFGFTGSPPQNRLYRYTYYEGAQLYALDPGFPVNLDGGGTEALTIDKDTTGTLWITYMLNGQLFVNRTIGGDDKVWGTPFTPPVPQGTISAVDDDACVEALPGQNKIGIFWSNQTQGAFYFATHTDGMSATDPAAWGFEIVGSGSSLADDHVNIKVSSDGRVFATVKTSRTAAGQTLVGLYVRATNGTWSALHKVTNVEFAPTRPNVLLDEVNRKVYVFYSSHFHEVYYKVSDLDTIAFDTTGVGIPLMISGTHPIEPGAGGPGGINNVTGTKQPVDHETGSLFIAATSETLRYWHNWILPPRMRPRVVISAPANDLKVRTGTAITFAATASSPDGVLTPSIAWSSSRDGALGTGGTITRSNLTPGVHTVTASATDTSHLTGTASVSVTVENDAPPVITLTSPTNGQRFRPGQAISFAGTAIDSLDGDRTLTMTWTSDRDGQIGTGGVFTRSDLSVGRHTITIRATDTASLVRTVTLIVDVVAVSNPTLTLTSPPTGRKYAFGTLVPFAATANDTFDGDISVRIAWSSDRDGSIGTGGSFSRATLSRGTHVISAAVTNTANLSVFASTSVTVEDDAPPMVTISGPTAPLFAAGKPITFTATAADSIDGDRTASLVWTSNLDGQIGTGGSFTKSNLTVGNHVVTATATDASNLTGVAQVNVEVRNQPAPTVAITAPADEAVVLFTHNATFTGTVTDTIDGNLAASLRWVSDRDGQIGTGASFTTSSLTLGRHTITASVTNSGNLTGTATIDVNVESGPQLSIFQPTDASVVAQGDPVTFSGIAFDFEDGDLSNGISWTSSRDGLIGTGASINTSTLTRGVHTITASATDSDNHIGTLQISIEIVARPTVLINAPANNSLFSFGQSITFTGFATDPVSGNLTSQLAWTSSLDGAIGTGASFSITTLRSGTHTITARATNGRGLTGQKQITVVVNDAPDVTITAPANGTTFIEGAPVAFSATATDREDGNIASSIVWTSSRDGAIGSGAGFSRSTLTPGVHVITATITDMGGRTDSDTRTITISGIPHVTIATPANGARLNLGSPVTFSATATDFEDGDKTAAIQWMSSRDGNLGTGGSITPSLTAGTHTITASVVDNAGNTGQAVIVITFNAPPTVTITAPASNADVEFGAPVTLRATATDPEQGDIAASVRWVSSRDGNLGQGGVLTLSTLTSGSHTITATATDADNASASAAITLIVNGGPVVTISTPATGTEVLPGASVTFTAAATDHEDGNVSANIHWASSRDGALFTGASFSTSNLSVGVHTITASATDSGGKTGSMQITLTVNTPPTVSITAPADNATFEPGAAVTFTGTANDVQDGSLTSAIQWTSSRDGSLGSGGSVNATALSTGTHTITASVTDGIGKTVTTSITITVNATPGVTITAPANNATFEPGQAITFTATALDAEDGNLGSVIAWTSSLDGTLSIGNSITVSTLRTGTHIITAAATDSGNKRGTATITITVHATPVVQITAPASGSVFEPGTINLTATATDAEDGDLATAVQWTSSRDGSLGTGGTISPSTLSSGTHTITASATDSGGKTGTATITLTVNETPTVAITTPADGSTSEPGAAVTFTGTATDLEDGSLTGVLDWTSSRDGHIGTGFTFTTGTLSTGTHVITASATDSGSKTGTATITITVHATPVIGITAPANGAMPEPGAPVTFTATANDVEDGAIAAIHWSSNVSGDLGTGASITRSDLATGAHTITASATDSGGKTGTASITITVHATPVVAITGPADGSTYEPGTQVTFTATATDVEDGDLAAAIHWVSSRDGALGDGPSLATTSLTSGTHVITASATDGGSKTGQASITVVVNKTPAAQITAPAHNATFEPGQSVTFTGSASDLEDGDLSAGLAWTSSRDGSLGDGASVTANALSTGTHVIHASVTDAGGKSAQSTITIVVDATPTVAITAPATGSVYEPAQAVSFTATATDPEDGDLAGAIHWTSSRDGALGDGASISISSLTSGTHVITASATDSASKTGSATITVVVNATPVVAITSPADGASPEPEAAVAFTATATDTEDGDLAAAVHWTSNVDGALGDGGSLSLTTLSTGTHVITASATDAGGKTGQASITIHVNATPTIAINAPATGTVYEPGTEVTFTGQASDAEQGDLSTGIAWTSSLNSSLGTGASISTSALSSGTHTIVAAVTDAGGKSATTAITITINATPTVSITAPASGTNFAPGAEATFTATANDPEDGTLANIAWSSDRDGSLGTGVSFSTTSLSTGAHVITAAATDSGGKTGLATVSITVDASPVVTIMAPANDATFHPGATAIFTATATDAEDGDVASSLAWSSNVDGSLGTGASISTSTLTAGAHTITATATDTAGKHGTASITVVIDAAPTVEITAPASGSIYEPGATATFAGTANDAEDGVLTTTIAWTSNLDGGLGIGGSVSSTTLSAGTHTITATVTDSRGSHGTASITITVNATPVVAITTPANGSAHEPGANVSFTATATDAEEGDLAAVIAWASDRDGALGTGASISTTTLSTGTHVITASATDAGGRTGSAQITVSVDTTPVVTITAPASGSNIEPGASVTLTATASDVEEGDLASSIAWVSDRDGALGTGGSIGTTTLSTGTHVITASATDTSGKTGSAQITIAVDATPTVAITAPASGSTHEPGATVTFAGTATDAEDGDLAAAIAWSSNLDGALGTGGSISTTTLSTGTHVITASATDTSGKTGSAQITVTIDATPGLSITAPASGTEVETGTSTTFSATATDAEDGDLGASVAWSSSIDGSLGAGATISSTLTAGTHVVTATVADTTGKTATGNVTVIVNSTPVVEITAPASGSTVASGAEIILTGSATDAEDGALTLDWTSDLDGPLGSGTSLGVTLSLGTHVITASATDAANKTASAQITITVDEAPVVSITTPADGAQLETGASVFAATATDHEDGDLAGSVHWESSLDGDLGTGASIIPSLTAGTHVVTASVTDSTSKTATASVTVVVDTTPELTIVTPGDGAALEPGASTTFTGTATDAESGDLSATINWTSSRDGDLGTGATVISTLTTGEHVITATVVDPAGRTATASIDVTVDATPTVSITTPADLAVFAPGASITFSGVANDAEQGDISEAIVWTSNHDGALGIGSSIAIDTLSGGTHTITATVTDSGGKTATDAITVRIDAPPSLTIDTPASGSTFAVGATVTLSGTATDAEDGTLSGTIAWTSDVDGALGAAASLGLTSLSAGVHTITATVTDAAGNTATDSITLTIDAAPSVSITSPADDSAVEVGTSVAFEATATDAEDGTLDGASVVWSSNIDGQLGLGASISAMLTEGDHTITVTATDAAGTPATASITVHAVVP
jgi:hypothetical protein